MNKVIAAAIVLSAFGTNANAQANKTTDALAKIVPAITLTTDRSLNFGNIIRGGGGVVKIKAVDAGDRTIVSGSPVLASGASSSAHFVVTGDGEAAYAITRSPLVTDPALTLTAVTGGYTMAVSIVVSNVAAGTETGTGTLGGTSGTDATQDIYVGGTLTIDPAQHSGTYQNVGGISITVDYN